MIEGLPEHLRKAMGLCPKCHHAMYYTKNKDWHCADCGYLGPNDPSVNENRKGENKFSEYYWMDPNCEMHPVGFGGHFRWAANLLGIDVNVYDTMYANGWVRVASSFDRGQRFVAFNYNSKKSPSNRQIKALKDFCIEIGCYELYDDTKGGTIEIDESRISLKRLIKEVESVEYPSKKLSSGVYQQQPADWRKFKLNGIYSDGDVLRYIRSQHGEFEDDDRVEGDYKLQAIDPNTIEDSEWSTDDGMVDSLVQSKKQFPPIVIDRQGSIIDGGHRHAAAKKRGDKHILVFKPTNDVNESVDGMMTERMTYNDLLRVSQEDRKDRAKTVRTRSLPVSTDNNEESWNFRYKANPSRTGHPHQGSVTFFKESSNSENAGDVECKVDCSCPDFKYRWAYSDTKQDASSIGNNSLSKCINRRPAVRNPRELPGMCKHLIALKDFLKTKIDTGSKQKLSESLNELTKTPTFNVEYND